MPRRIPPPNAQRVAAPVFVPPPPLWVYLLSPPDLERWYQAEALLSRTLQNQRLAPAQVRDVLEREIDGAPRELPLEDANNARGAYLLLMMQLRFAKERIMRLIRDPYARQYVSWLMSGVISWSKRGAPEPLEYSDANPDLWTGFRQAFADNYPTPVSFIMENLFLPICSMVDRTMRGILAKEDLTFRPGQRHLIFAIITIESRDHHRWNYRLLPGMVRDLWDLDDLLNPEMGNAPDVDQGSGTVQLAIRMHQDAMALSFKIVRSPLRVSQGRRRRVGIFPLVSLNPVLDLSRYQVYNEAQIKALKGPDLEHCLIHALRLSRVPEPTLQSIARLIPGRMVTLTALERVFERANLAVEVTYAEAACWSHVRALRLGSVSPDAQQVKLGLIENHVFINEPCAVTTLYLANWRRLRPDQLAYPNITRIDHGAVAEVAEEPQCTSFEILNWMYNHEDQLRLPGMYEVSIPYRKSLLQENFDPESLEYDHRISTRPITSDADNGNTDEAPAEIWFADFETFVSKPVASELTGEIQHQPFLLCYGKRGYETTASDCVGDLRWALELMMSETTATGNAIIYFHNLSYDGTFILNVLRPCEGSIVEQGSSRIIRFRVRWNEGRWAEFRDSLALMPFPLRKFPEMLGVEAEKEIMPYKAYNAQTYRENLTPTRIRELDLSYSDSELRAAGQRAGAWDDQGGRISMWEYAVYYCRRDVEVLCEGYWRFDEMMYNATGQHLWARLTAPSLAFHSLRLKKVFDGCYELCGTPALAIRNTVVGGRCMLAFNRKQHTREDVADFDAVSLYPSAMAVLYTLKGIPKVLTAEDINLFALRRDKWDGFFIKIRILTVGRELAFPLISYKRKGGGREFVNEPGELWVNDITLDDLVEFHHITFEVLKGYYFDSGKNYTIQEVIKELFQLRLDAKRAKQAIEVVYKMLMNSCYGKTIMKPRATRKEIMTEKQLMGELMGTPFTIVGYQELENKNFLVRTAVDVLDNWSIPATGSHILAMSKRIVTRVTSLAQELDIPVYYTDTDSIHILKDQVPRLAEAYRGRYGKELIGKDLGQFHTDFPCTSRGMMWSRHFIGVGKKAYLDVLTDGVEERYHIRLKGIPERSLLAYCENHNITPETLYERFLANPEFTATFNLADAGPCFDRKSNLTIFSLSYFPRTVGFK